MKIAEKNKSFVARFHYLWPPLIVILSGYLGIDEYQDRKAATLSNVSVEVITASNEEVLSRIDVDTLIKNAIEAQHKKNLVTFKQKESWEK